MLCAFNLGGEPAARWRCPTGDWRTIGEGDFAGTIEGREIVLPPAEALFAEPA